MLKTGNLSKKQAQNALSGKLNKTKSQQENQKEKQGDKSEKQAQNEQIYVKTRPKLHFAINQNSKSTIKLVKKQFTEQYLQ